MEQVRLHDIWERYEDALEGDIDVAPDLYIFEEIVRPFYSPSRQPIAMCVGVMGEKSPRSLRAFHERCYGIPRQDTKVVGCNKRDFSGHEFLLPDYDFLMTGFQGDATHEFTWHMPFGEFDVNRWQYDLSLIRNPDLVSVDEWSAIFRRGMQYTGPDGVLVTIIRERDVRKYQNLLGQLKEHEIEPAFSGQTGIKNPQDSFRENHHHTIGIFKSSQK